MRWQTRVDELLYDSESVQGTLDVGTARVVVTSHRVMVFTPELEGENFRQADRPNVIGVDTGAKSNLDLLGRGIRYSVIGGLLVAAGLVFDFEEIIGDVSVGDAGGGQVGLGGILEMTQRMLDLFAQLDVILQALGALVLLVAVAVLGVYWYLRDPTIVITLAGEEGDIHMPRPADADQTLADLERLVFPDSEAPEGDVAGNRTQDRL